MDDGESYPCPVCGTVADTAGGCPGCGRPPDPVAARLARLNRSLSALDQQSHRLAAGQAQVSARRNQLMAERSALSSALARKLADETAVAEAKRPPKKPGTATATATVDTVRPQGTEERLLDLQPGVEQSTRSAQNTLLGLGGLLLGIAAIVFTIVAYTTADPGGRAFFQLLGTTVGLGVPVLLARRALTATAETIAGIGLLLVLLDGYAIYSVDLAGLKAVPGPVYAAILFALLAGVAAGYRLVTQLMAPQYAALLAVQPLLPLLATQWGLGRAGYSVVFALVAAQNLVAQQVTKDTVKQAAWGLFGLALATSVALAGLGLYQASTVEEGTRAALALVFAAGVGVVASRLTDRSIARQVALGGATLAVIASVSRVDALAWPDYTLVLTAALAAAAALIASSLPEESRQGPRVAALFAAALTGLAVAYGASLTAVATVRAAIRPDAWAADLGAYAERVQVTSWQVPAAAVLVTVVAASATPLAWRVDAVVFGGLLVVLAAPGSGSVAWWLIPFLGIAAATAAAFVAMAAEEYRSAILRAGVAALLGLHALATSLARPGLTATALTALALAGVGLSIVGNQRTGPYVERVVDVATGAATLGMPLAVGAYAYLLNAPDYVLLPLTMLATSASLIAASLAQLVGKVPRTVTAAGGLIAAGACLTLALRADRVATGDLLLAILLVAVGLLCTAARAFEVPSSGLVLAVETAPEAVGALVESIEGDHDVVARRERRRRPVDGITLAAAGATAGMIAALARLVAVVVPGLGLVTTTAMVFVTALAVRLLPPAWRRGPRFGVVGVGGTVGALAAGVALYEAASVIQAGTPWWRADLSTWDVPAPYGWQVPATLLLAAAAAWALLPGPRGGDVAYLALCLAGLAATAAFALAWWAPVPIALTLALVAGLGAALTHTDYRGPDIPQVRRLLARAVNLTEVRAARERLALAAVLSLYAVAAGMATPEVGAAALFGVIGIGIAVAILGQSRKRTPSFVPGIATAAAIAALPAAASVLAAASGTPRSAVISVGMVASALGVPAVYGLRGGGMRWLAYPVGAVGLSALVVALTSIPDLTLLTVHSGLAVAIAVAAAEVLRPDRRAIASVLAVSALPAAIIAVLASAPAWLVALFGPYRTARNIWSGYAATPVPPRAGAALVALALLTGSAVGAAMLLGGRRYVLAAVLPPLAALALLAPTALGLPREVTPWVALAVAITAGLGAALAPPTVPSATKQLRTTAAVICLLAGGAGLAGSLATRSATLVALMLIAGAGLVAATAGRDPAVRMVAWLVAAAAGLAFPITAFAAAGADLRPSAFGVLAVCALLVAADWWLARFDGRRGEAAVVEFAAYLGAAIALLLTVSSPGYAAAVLTIWGVLLGLAALRRDRAPGRRRWLIWAAALAELAAAWLLLYTNAVGLVEAYTLPFAAVAVVIGGFELRRRPELSSWIAYGPALAAGYLPSLALILIGPDHVLRKVAVFVAAVATVILGAWRRRLAPVVVGGAAALIVAGNELLVLLVRGGVVAWVLLIALGGVALIAVGATQERRRRDLRRLRGALSRMS